MLIVPAEVAELRAVRAWAETGLGNGSIECIDSASFARAPYSLRVFPYDLVLCDTCGGEERGLDLLRDARAHGQKVPFLFLTQNGPVAALEAEPGLGPTERIARAGLDAEILARAVAPPEAARGPEPMPAPGAAPGPEPMPVPEAARGPEPMPVPEAARGPEPMPVPEAAPLQAPPAPAAAAPARSSSRSSERVPAMLWSADAAGELVAFTREWCAFTGRSEAEERSGGWLHGLHPGDRDRWRHVYQRARADRAAFSIDLRLRVADGGFRWVRMKGEPRRTASGDLAGFAGSACDVGDLVRDRDAALRRVHELEVANAELEQLGYALAHDLQEPLRGIETTLREVCDTRAGDAGDDEDGAFVRSLAIARRMQSMIRDLLECATLTTRGDEFAPTDLSEPLQWALSNLSSQVAEADARVTSDRLPVVSCDASQIARVFQNLIGNALKYRGDRPVLVHVGAERVGDEIVLSVRDNGSGIDPSEHETVFEIFGRGSGVTVPGNGVGLALARRIIERHGGRIWISSEPGKGTTVFVTLVPPETAADGAVLDSG